MPLGILDDNKLEHIPGTAPLHGLHEVDTYSGINPSLLKHDSTGQIVLVPQPSDSPNDPYNWPRFKKELFTIAYGWGCGCVGAVGPLLGGAFVPLAAEFGVSLSTFVSAVQGGLISAIAVGSLIFNSLAVKYGKRPIYLGTTVGLMVSCFWAAEAKSFESFVASRVLCGLCMAPMEALVPASIADIWFVHERGFRTAIFNLGVLGGINLAVPIAAAIIEYGSFRIALHAMGGAFALTLIMVFFWMPESAYAREALNIDTGETNVAAEGKTDLEQLENAASTGVQTAEVRHSWAKELLPYSGYVNHVSFWNTIIRPFYLLASPPVLWAVLLFTNCIAWLVGISLTLSQIFSAPPYNFSVMGVGATNLSSFVASVLGTFSAGPLIDGLVTRMSKMNGGIFEPEFRLPIMLTYLLFTSTGFFAWGQSSYAQDPWPVPVIVCLGMINFGVQLGTTGVVTYIVDCHREKAGEAFATMNFLKNLFAFGLSFYLNGWIDSQGVRNCFFTIGGITMAAALCTIPMYIFGKRARSWVHRHGIADRL
ncbi:major facilitator superfamily domain-containing protein [Aspergillus pseudotamarii]|uniref:Major facilitator superfamily domain-containing protein n=1 Tax=Aspergillus pseudotamarii TaxID=132259 RepID=A0A5N6T9T8_ASPPS|nr:major facilitator superfamily domain-containing protein [Aspergillus pseudotamarii]KAE8143115.1 major facilitator superfamily domain-containing protein [Aspergillus pseudotamarii]